MKIFVAGAAGVIGRRLVPALVRAGHKVSGTTRHRERVPALIDLGARPIVVDVLNATALKGAIYADGPDVIIHQLTDLSDQDFAANIQLRIEGTRNLVEAAKAADVSAMIAQSIAWVYQPGTSPATESDPLDPGAPPYAGVAALEEALSEMPRGVALRYGALYGPGTWYAPGGAVAQRVMDRDLSLTPSWTSFVHVDDAARAAVTALDWPAGPVNVVDDEPATALDWLPVYAEALGAPPPGVARHAAAIGRPVSNALAYEMGWKPEHPTWRTGFPATLR